MPYKFIGDRIQGQRTKYVIVTDLASIVRRVGVNDRVDISESQFNSLNTRLVFEFTDEPANAPSLDESDNSPAYIMGGGVSSSPTWREPVALISNLPLTGSVTGEVRLVLENMSLYGWQDDAWIQLT